MGYATSSTAWQQDLGKQILVVVVSNLTSNTDYGHCGLWQTERLWESPSGLTPGLVDTFWRNGESSDAYYFYTKRTYWGSDPNSSIDQVKDGSREEDTAAKGEKQKTDAKGC